MKIASVLTPIQLNIVKRILTARTATDAQLTLDTARSLIATVRYYQRAARGCQAERTIELRDEQALETT